MNWSSQINRFQPLTADDVPLFAPPREMEQAVATYNKAIDLLSQDSLDIARIALRKLAASYPLFPQPAFLLGCCLALSGQSREALGWVEQALLAGLPEQLDADARQCQASLKKKATASPEQSGAEKPVASLPIQTANILEKTRRRGKVKMASEREKREVLRRSEFPEEEETFVVDKRLPADWLRLALPIVAGLLVLVTLILAGIRWLPESRLFQRPKSDAVRLAWLLEQLSELSVDQESAASLLQAYHQHFDSGQPDLLPTPTPDATPTTTPVPTPTLPPQPTATPLPTATPAPTPEPTPTIDPAVTDLERAAETYTRASQALADEDLAQAGIALVQARDLLADLPDDTRSGAVPLTAGEQRAEVDRLMESIAVASARELRLLAEPEFAAGDYEAALQYYLPAYEIYPRAYGGGVAYYVGRCYQLLGQTETAKPYFEFVIAQFPGRDIARSAAYRLSEMGD